MAPKRKPPTAAVAAAEGVPRRSPRQHEGTRTPTVADPKPPRKKKAKTEAAAGDSEASAPPSETVTVEGSKTIVIEHCKQCRSFNRRAEEVKQGLEKDVAGVNIVVNPEKPRRGCFEIRVEGGEVFVSLLDMKRPFTPMKQLDMEKVVSDIVEKIR